MTQELSTLMDGELEAHEAQRTIGSCCGSEELKQKWQAYHLIGEAMRGERPCRSVATDRIMAALRDEPTVLAPRRLLGRSAGRIAFAAAASVATVAVVGWIGVQGSGAPQGPTVAKAVPAEPPSQVAANVMPAGVHEFVVVHRQLPNADFYRPASNTAPVAR